MNKKVLSLVQGAMIAALYAVLFYAQDFIFPGTASMAVQFRVAGLAEAHQIALPVVAAL